MCKALALVSGLICLGLATPASADQIEEDPTPWRLEVFTSNHSVAVYFTGATNCTTGRMTMGNASVDDMNRFYSLVLAAKMAKKPVGIFYSATNGNCVIDTFYIQ